MDSLQTGDTDLPEGSVTTLAAAMRLALELALARSVGRLSRLAGRGGGTTLPGKILATIDPDARHDARRTASGGHRRRLGHERQDDDRGARRRDPLPRAPARPQPARAPTSSPASRRRWSSARDAQLGLFEVDEGAFPDVARRIRPRAVCLGNLFRDQLDRYGELERIAERWREAVGTLPATRRSSSTPTIRRSAIWSPNAPGSVTFGLDDPSQARPSLQHAADSKYCLRCGTPYDYAAAYVGHLGDYRCPACGHARPSA